MNKGIYCFVDKKTGIVVYIGRFTGRKRIKSHYYPSLYDAQRINRVLQNNPDRYEAKIICEYPELTNDELNYLEIKEIFKHKFLYDEIPKFNFTIGGDGVSGFTFTEESRQKISENHPKRKDYPRIIKGGKSKQGKQQYCIIYNGKIIKTSINRNKLESFLNKNYNALIAGGEIKELPWYKIIKRGFDMNGKQVYNIVSNGKTLKQSIYIERLEEWFKNNYPNEVLHIEGVL